MGDIEVPAGRYHGVGPPVCGKRQSSVGGKMRGRALVVLAGLAVIAVIALIGGAVLKNGSHSAARYSKFSLSDPDSKAQTPGLGPGMTWDAYLQAADAYPAANV